MSVINGQGPARPRSDQYFYQSTSRHRQSQNSADVAEREQPADVLRSGSGVRPSIVTDIGSTRVQSAQSHSAAYRVEPHAASQAFLELNKLQQMRDDGTSGIVTVEQGPLRRQRDLDELPLRSQAAVNMYSSVAASDMSRRGVDVASAVLLGVDLFV